MAFYIDSKVRREMPTFHLTEHIDPDSGAVWYDAPKGLQPEDLVGLIVSTSYNGGRMAFIMLEVWPLSNDPSIYGIWGYGMEDDRLNYNTTTGQIYHTAPEPSPRPIE